MSNISKDEISLTQVWAEVFKRKLVIIISGFTCSIIAVFIALSLPNMYKAKVLTVPKLEEQGGLGSLAKNLGGLANIAGINVGKSRGPDKTAVAIQILKSQRFINEFIIRHQLIVPLMAAKGSEGVNFTLILDDDKYDVKNKKWLREVKPPRTSEPTAQEVYERFMELVEINHDPKDGFVDISIEFYSPYLAVKWVELLLADINEEIRKEDIQEAQSSIDFLNEIITATVNKNMQETFYQLIEEQTKVLMLAKSRKEYVFKTISPALVPEKRSKPNKILIVIAGGVLGGSLSFLWILIRFFTRKL